MKKVLWTAVVLLALISHLSAQITFRMDDFPCTPGTVVTQGVGAFMDNQAGEGGEDNTWDFSAIATVAFEVSETWALPDQLPGSENFPTANLCMMGDEGPDGTRMYTFFNHEGTRIVPVGHSYYLGSMDTTFIITMDVHGHYFDFPLQYGDTWDLTQVMVVNGETEIDSIHFVVDSYGTMTDRMGTFECIRLQMHETNHNIDTGEIETEYKYYWYAQDYGEICHVVSEPNEENPNFSGGTIFRVTDVTGWEAVQDIPSDLPLEYVIKSPYPNPFNSTVRVPFVLNNHGNVQISLYSIQGQFIGTLYNSHLTAGHYSPSLELAEFSSGSYFIRVDVNGQSTARKITLLK